MKIYSFSLLKTLSLGVFLFALDTFSRLIHFKIIYNRVMTNKILLKMNLADSSTYLFCNREETVVHAFLECENVTRFWRSIECWIRRVIDRHFKLPNVDTIFGTLPMNITINTVNLAAQEIIYRNSCRQIETMIYRNIAPLHLHKWDASFIIRWLKKIYKPNGH